MDLKKCKIGHFYDGDKYPECPHCKDNVKERVTQTNERKRITESKKNSTVTQALGSIEEKRQEREEKKSSSRRPIDDTYVEDIEIKSVEVIEKKIKRKDLGPVVGWLIGISGSAYGHSFELFATSNTIGSSSENVVIIEEAAGICSKSHCIICFDINTLNFYLDYDNSGGKIKINNYSINQNVYVNYMDVLEIGDSTYAVIPLCRDGFSWWGNLNNVEQSQYSTQTTYEEIVYQPDNRYIEDSNEVEEQELTGILIASPWRCSDCNALNSMMFNKCRTCGKSK